MPDIPTIESVTLPPRLTVWQWFMTPEHFTDRRIQSCFVVLFCAVMVVWVVSMGGSSPVSTRIIDWSFTVMLGTVGIFHIARGVDEAMINNVAADAARTLAAESVIHKASNGHVTTVVSGE